MSELDDKRERLRADVERIGSKIEWMAGDDKWTFVWMRRVGLAIRVELDDLLALALEPRHAERTDGLHTLSPEEDEAIKRISAMMESNPGLFMPGHGYTLVAAANTLEQFVKEKTANTDTAQADNPALRQMIGDFFKACAEHFDYDEWAKEAGVRTVTFLIPDDSPIGIIFGKIMAHYKPPKSLEQRTIEFLEKLTRQSVHGAEAHGFWEEWQEKARLNDTTITDTR